MKIAFNLSGQLPPLISEELWHNVIESASKNRHISDAGRLHTPRRLSWSDASMDTKLRCRCGGRFNRFKWRAF